jgi:predicted methyltransferase
MKHPLALALAFSLSLVGVGCGSSTPEPSPPSVAPPPVPFAETTASPAAAPPAPAPVTFTSTAPAPASDIPPAIQAAVSASDRSTDDRALDAGRHPDRILAFFGIAPGMRVAELGAGGGYTAELLARTVGPTGRVYAQNPKFILERFAEKPWSERLQKSVMANVVRADRELEDPLPPDAKNLDAVVLVLFYHDSVWMKTDRSKMNRAIFAALKAGGTYGIIDHSGRAGTGTSEAETLHRIEEKVVRDEVTRAGFALEAEADFLKNPSDARDWNVSPKKAAERRGTSDRFVLRFKKP